MRSVETLEGTESQLANVFSELPTLLEAGVRVQLAEGQ
jgi:hypothetical protein